MIRLTKKLYNNSNIKIHRNSIKNKNIDIKLSNIPLDKNINFNYLIIEQYNKHQLIKSNGKVNVITQIPKIDINHEFDKNNYILSETIIQPPKCSFIKQGNDDRLDFIKNKVIFFDIILKKSINIIGWLIGCLIGWFMGIFISKILIFYINNKKGKDYIYNETMDFYKCIKYKIINIRNKIREIYNIIIS